MKVAPTQNPKQIAVIGAGPAGLSAAIVLQERGHKVTIFEAAKDIGGQLRLAAKIPGKEDFKRLLAYYQTMIERLQIPVERQTASPNALKAFDVVVIATGVKPRIPDVQGIENGVPYDALIEEGTNAKSVAIMGSGPIGFDVASLLVETSNESIEEWRSEWGVVSPQTARGGLGTRHTAKSPKRVTMLQRSQTRFGKALGKTTGWIHRARLEAAGIEMIGGVNYEEINADGIELSKDDNASQVNAELIAICAGQESVNELYQQCLDKGLDVHIIGGAKDAHKIDAERAIREAYELALKL